MAESYRYKVLVKAEFTANGTNVVYTNTTSKQETVVTDILCRTYFFAQATIVFLQVNGKRIRMLLPDPSGQIWDFGLWVVLLQGDTLGIEIAGLPASRSVNVRMFGFERFNAPIPGVDTYNYKMTTGNLYWNSGPAPIGTVATIYTGPVDSVFLIHSFWVGLDNPTQRWNFEFLLDDIEVQHVALAVGGVAWEGRDRRKIIIEPGQTVKLRIIFVTGTPTQGLLWCFGGVERKNQP